MKKDCWLWKGARSSSGYGHVRINGKLVEVHRLSYRLNKGPIPKGLELDHKCRVRNCFNPDHLEPVTTRVNILRGQGTAAKNARKTHCQNGHPFSKKNTYRDPGKTWRRCRKCMIRRGTEWKRRKRASK